MCVKVNTSRGRARERDHCVVLVKYLHTCTYNNIVLLRVHAPDVYKPYKVPLYIIILYARELPICLLYDTHA